MADTQTPEQAKAARIAAATALKAKREELKANVGLVFTDGEATATIAQFEQNDVGDGTTADVFIVNFGNKFVHKHIACDEFLTNFKPKE